MTPRSTPVEESRVIVALRGDREGAERLAARLCSRGLTARVAAPGRRLRRLPPGRWAVEVAGSQLAAALEQVDAE